jgi:hypothetical protein
VSSHLINAFHSLCVTVDDAVACIGPQNALETEIPDILNWTDLLISTIVDSHRTLTWKLSSSFRPQRSGEPESRKSFVIAGFPLSRE